MNKQNGFSIIKMKVKNDENVVFDCYKYSFSKKIHCTGMRNPQKAKHIKIPDEIVEIQLTGVSFPEIEEIVLSENLTLFKIRNSVFPNIQKIDTSKNKKFVWYDDCKSFAYYNGETDLKILQNVFSKSERYVFSNDIFDIENYAFEGTKCTDIIFNDMIIDNLNVKAFCGSEWIKHHPDFFIYNKSLLPL